jgi:DNA-binding transcriptional regulator GbsR (MarR family)
MSMLTYRHSDHARLKADYKRQARVFVAEQPLDREFTAADLSHATGMAFSSASNHLRELERKGLTTGCIKPRDLRRYYKRVAGAVMR